MNTPPPADYVTIRPASPKDVGTVYHFLCELEDEQLDLPRFQAIFALNLTNPMIYYLIAERAGERVGFVSCYAQYLLHHVGKVGEIQELFVRSDQRNQRIGHKLVTALFELATREGFVNLEVTTNQKRTDTIRFYERESFKCTHHKLVKPIQF
ncbi:GNAT family N-acetyltransferase [Spirosoma agri]|uniref:GNAT family N-acetyltransferase n=1 Tax=Spirosoma agri TaxID=1987381 RepID=A0A6M0ID62_9BACT|nr:GNAT family N-acetyltransferase [Spirosoma agri]NEU66088.1 GNAT family N-acetyltransferase [Spirosoma agri]